MTPVAFSRYFKRMTGRNVSDFINDLRISRAAELLRDTGHSVTHIAADAGYPTLSNFFRRFRERFGCSPLVYRRDSDYPATPKISAPRAVSRLRHHQGEPAQMIPRGRMEAGLYGGAPNVC